MIHKVIFWKCTVLWSKECIVSWGHIFIDVDTTCTHDPLTKRVEMKGYYRWDVTKNIIQDWKIENIHILTLCITVILFQSPINGLPTIKKKKPWKLLKNTSSLESNR